MDVGYLSGPPDSADGYWQVQRQAIIDAGVSENRIYAEELSGERPARRQLRSCLRQLTRHNRLVVWQLDRLGDDLGQIVSVIAEVIDCGAGLTVVCAPAISFPAGAGFGGDAVAEAIATLAQCQRRLDHNPQQQQRPRTVRESRRRAGRKFQLSQSEIRLAQSLMAKQDATNVSKLCRELGIARTTLYRYVGPDGQLRPHGKRALNATEQESV